MLGPKMRRFSIVFLIAGVVLQSGCEKGPTRPAFTYVRVVVTATPVAGGPSAPVSMNVLITNAGKTTVWRCGDWCCDPIDLWVLGPDGSPVALRDPNEPLPAMPCGPAVYLPIEPKETLRSGGKFTGVLYQRDSTEWPSPTYAAPSGTYTMFGAFTYRSSPSGEPTRVESKTTFTWLQ